MFMPVRETLTETWCATSVGKWLSSREFELTNFEYLLTFNFNPKESLTLQPKGQNAEDNLALNIVSVPWELNSVHYVQCQIILGLIFGSSLRFFWDIDELSAMTVLVRSNNFLWRVWSWLRTNAGGVLNTCKSNDEARACSGELVANGWVTRE